MTQAYPYLRKPKYRVITQYDGDADPSHPLKTVDEVFERITVATQCVSGLSYHNNQEQIEKDIFRLMMEQEEVQWAHDNSFDKPHFSKQSRLESDETCFRVTMYLKPEHCTFWRLQFG